MLERVVQSRERQIGILPRGFHLTSAKVEVAREGGDIVLCEKRPDLGRVYDLIRQLPADMVDDGPPQYRAGL